MYGKSFLIAKVFAYGVVASAAAHYFSHKAIAASADHCHCQCSALERVPDIRTSNNDLKNVQRVFLEAHNKHRANHSVPEVIWDDNIAASAKELADSCVYGHDTIGGGGYGQNIAMGAETNFALSDKEVATRVVSRQWYNDELELYTTYGTEPQMDDLEEWGHLTQLVWEATTRIGCSVAICKGGALVVDLDGYFAVCNYFSAGNVKSQFANNIHPPTGAPRINV